MQTCVSCRTLKHAAMSRRTFELLRLVRSRSGHDGVGIAYCDAADRNVGACDRISLLREAGICRVVHAPPCFQQRRLPCYVIRLQSACNAYSDGCQCCYCATESMRRTIRARARQRCGMILCDLVDPEEDYAGHARSDRLCL